MIGLIRELTLNLYLVSAKNTSNRTSKDNLIEFFRMQRMRDFPMTFQKILKNVPMTIADHLFSFS